MSCEETAFRRITLPNVQEEILAGVVGSLVVERNREAELIHIIVRRVFNICFGKGAKKTGTFADVPRPVYLSFDEPLTQEWNLVLQMAHDKENVATALVDE